MSVDSMIKEREDIQGRASFAFGLQLELSFYKAL